MTAAELAALAAELDARLADETADRQLIAEEASARVKAIAGRLAAADARPAGITPMGPFEAEHEAAATPAVRAVYAAFGADPGPGKMTPHNHAMLCQAIEAAGVELGAYDHRIVSWLAGWEPATCAVVAGLITRAAAAGEARGRQMTRDALGPAREAAVRAAAGAVVPLADHGTLLDALSIAADELRDRAAFCGECDGNPYCVVCESRLSRAEGFERAAGALGGAR